MPPILYSSCIPLTGRNPSTLPSRLHSSSDTLYSYPLPPGTGHSTRYTPCCAPKTLVLSGRCVCGERLRLAGGGGVLVELACFGAGPFVAFGGRGFLGHFGGGKEGGMHTAWCGRKASGWVGLECGGGRKVEEECRGGVVSIRMG